VQNLAAPPVCKKGNQNEKNMENDKKHLRRLFLPGLKKSPRRVTAPVAD